MTLLQKNNGDQQLTLAELKQLQSVVALQRLFEAAGMNPTAMRTRVSRHRPELTSDESAALLTALKRCGLSYEFKSIENSM